MKSVAYIAVGMLFFFLALCFSNIARYSPTYDEMKFLEIGQQLAAGQGWQTEMSVVHAPLSFYTHGFLLKPFKFESDMQRLRWARTIMLVYSAATAGLIFWWASALYGGWGGALALALYLFNSNILGHSSLVTTDIIYACFSLFLLYFLWKFLEEGRVRSAAASGVCLGLALLAKYSAVLWFLLLPFLTGTLVVRDVLRKRAGRTPACQPLGRVFAGIGAIVVIALIVLNIGYGFSGSLAPLGAHHYQSNMLGRLADSPLASWIPVPIPYPFMRGYDAQKSISELGHPSFLAGMRSTQGWWYYYAACFALKMPMMFWPLMIWAAISLARAGGDGRRTAEALLLGSAVTLVAANSFLSKSHAGFRYVMTALPPLFIFGGAAVAQASSLRKKAGLALIVLLYALPSLWIHPHHLAYFSALAGGPKSGYKWLSDSNLDWGQNFDDARAYMRGSNVPLTVNPGMLPVPGRILINATTLQDCFSTDDIHGWLRPFKPIDNIGYSWLMFDVDEGTLGQRKRVPGDLPDEYYLAAFAYARDRLQDAERLALAALSSDSGLPEALYLLGLSRLGLANLKGAQEALQAIPAAHPFYVDARRNLSLISALQEDVPKSVQRWREAMLEETLRTYAVRPSIDPEAYRLESDLPEWKRLNNLGVCLWARGDLAGAEQALRRAHEAQPDFVEGLASLAVVLEQRGRFEDALDTLIKYLSNFLSLRASPYRDYRVYYGGTRVMMGNTIEITPQPDEQVLRLKAYLMRRPEDIEALNQLAVSLMRLGRFGEAHVTLRKALGASPNSDVLYTNLAVLYTEKKMFGPALEACRRAITINPGNASARELFISLRDRVLGKS
jgi:tetratricopeptide (TPR) repeat protein